MATVINRFLDGSIQATRARYSISASPRRSGRGMIRTAPRVRTPAENADLTERHYAAFLGASTVVFVVNVIVADWFKLKVEVVR